MKQTMAKLNEATSTSSATGAEWVGTNLLRSTTTVHAVAPNGHEGHVMPMSPKTPVAKPANEKMKPKVPPKPPAAKPPAKQAKSRLQVERSCRELLYAPTPGVWRCPTSPRI